MADNIPAPFAFMWEGHDIQGTVTPVRYHFVDYEVKLAVDGIGFEFIMRPLTPSADPWYGVRQYTRLDSPDVRRYMEVKTSAAATTFDAAIRHIVAALSL